LIALIKRLINGIHHTEANKAIIGQDSNVILRNMILFGIRLTYRPEPSIVQGLLKVVGMKYAQSNRLKWISGRRGGALENIIHIINSAQKPVLDHSVIRYHLKEVSVIMESHEPVIKCLSIIFL
jgi:hypothetical protein